MPRPKSPVRSEWLDPAVCSLDYRHKIIGRLPFFKHLPAEAIVWINGFFHDLDVTTGQTVYYEGEEAEYLYLVALGKVKMVRSTEAGREVLMDILGGGDYFGTLPIFGKQTHSESAVAQTDGCILRVSAVDFEKILSRHPDVMRKVLEAVGQRLEESQEMVRQLSTFSVEQRVASVLLRLGEKMGEARGKDILIQLPLSRQDLASLTGSTPETVSRVMSRFSDDRLVKTGRKWVTITNPGGLGEIIKSGANN